MELSYESTKKQKEISLDLWKKKLKRRDLFRRLIGIGSTPSPVSQSCGHCLLYLFLYILVLILIWLYIPNLRPFLLFLPFVIFFNAASIKTHVSVITLLGFFLLPFLGTFAQLFHSFEQYYSSQLLSLNAFVIPILFLELVAYGFLSGIVLGTWLTGIYIPHSSRKKGIPGVSR